MPRPTRQRDHLDVIAWNCHVANRDVLSTLRAWKQAYNPDVFMLCEAGNHHGELQRLAGYTLVQESPVRARADADVPEHGDCAILIRNDHAIAHARVDTMTQRWLVFSHKRWHAPRRSQCATARIRGRRWRLRSSHGPTNGFSGGNSEAFREFMDRSRSWLRRGVLLPSVDAGDFNEVRSIIAAWFGDRFTVAGKGIDVAVARGVQSAQWWELGKGGSDHHGRRYRFTA